MKKILSKIAPFFGGVIFAIGLGVGGMTQPSKIVGFLDIFGDWDPTLVFVMLGAICVYAVSYRLIKKRNVPLFTDKFHLPTRRDVDARLITGATIFGIGWGLSGFCPGPGLTALVSNIPEVMVFVVSMLLGMSALLIYQFFREKA